MPDFHLFRVRVESPRQTDLWGEVPSEWWGSSSAIRHALGQTPAFDSRNRGQWHLGGVTEVATNAYYFKIGRITKRIQPQWDPARQDFVDVETKPAPYTHAIIDLETQVCGVAMNRWIASTPRALGRKLAALLDNSRVGEAGFRFWVNEILNPSDFIAQIQEAYAIKKFSFTAFRPNFPDPSDLARALEEYVQRIDAEAGQAIAKGISLDAKRVEREARRTIAAGGAVSARVQSDQRERPATIKPGQTPVVVRDADVDTADQRSAAHARIVGKYQEVRGADDDTKE